MTMTTKQSGIYRITNLETGAMYIGRTAGTFARRWAQHRSALKNGRHRNSHLQSSYNKHGKDAFEYKVLEVIPRGDMSDQEFNDYINAREMILITEHDTHQNGYNFTEGGDGQLGREVSEATKLKLSRANAGKPLSAEHLAKLTAVNQGHTYNLGHKHTAETRAKVSASLMGNTRSLGYKHTAEARANMSAAKKGKGTALKGKPWSPARRAAQEELK